MKALTRKKSSQGKLSMREKLAFGLGDLSYNILMAGISFYLLIFMVTVAGLKPALAGVVFIISKVWDAITDYLMGRISDKTKCKYGKRRIYMLLGSIPFMITFACLWIIPNTDSQGLKFCFYTLMYMLYNTAATVVYIPYNSLAANMTDDYDERSTLNSIKIILANVGILLGAALFGMLAEGEGSLLYNIFGGGQRYAYLVAGVIFGLIAAVAMVICTCNVKERNTTVENSYGFFATLKQLFHLKEFRHTMIYYLLSMTAFDIIMATFMFLVQFTLGFGKDTISMIFVAIPLVVAMISATFWLWVSKKKGKSFAYSTAAILIFFVLIAVLFLPEKNIPLLVIICILVGFCMGSLQVMPWASLPDIVEVDEYVNGARREGAYYGIVSFIYKVASGLSLAIVSWTLAIFGFIENSDLLAQPVVQPESALIAIRYLFALLPGIIFVVSTYFSKKSQISKERYNDIVAELNKRKLAKTV